MRKKIVKLVIASLVLSSCSKDWTTPESKANEFEDLATKDLVEKRDSFKWIAEGERAKENEEAREAYYASLREYKKKAWLNTGEAGGQKPMFYFWYSSDAWTATEGVAKSWLQVLPDSITAISMWGGLAIRPNEVTPNMKKDLEIFQKKGSVVLMCWQTSAPGLGIPGSPDKQINGWTHFRNKYPYEPTEKDEHKWSSIYARDLARYIIAMGFDGYDVDWETCGDHGSVTPDGHSFMIRDGGYKNIADFVKELCKYFGPKYSGEEREKYLTELFDPNTPGYHPNEKEFIDDFKPFVPDNYTKKKYYLCADIPCGVAPIFDTSTFAEYFDKHFMQDYTVSGVGGHIQKLGGIYMNSTSANYQANGYHVIPAKAEAIKKGEIWGFGAYHGQTDFANTQDFDSFKQYTNRNGLKRKYNSYAWTREAMRIADPRPASAYEAYKEHDTYIIKP